jgi:hypothetical protein
MIIGAPSLLRTVFARSALEPLHPAAPLLLPLQHHGLALHHDGAAVGGVLAQHEVGGARPQLGAAALHILPRHPDVHRALLLEAASRL